MKNYDEELFYEYISDLLNNEKVQEMKNYIHHGNTTCYEHCISVAELAFSLANKHPERYDVKSVTRGALLHDLFLYDWKTYGDKLHGFHHPKIALKNAKEITKLNEIEEDIILTHMWTLTIKLPKYKESYIIIYADKHACSSEVYKKQCAQYSKIYKAIIGTILTFMFHKL